MPITSKRQTARLVHLKSEAGKPPVFVLAIGKQGGSAASDRIFAIDLDAVGGLMLSVDTALALHHAARSRQLLATERMQGNG